MNKWLSNPMLDILLVVREKPRIRLEEIRETMRNKGYTWETQEKARKNLLNDGLLSCYANQKNGSFKWFYEYNITPRGVQELQENISEGVQKKLNFGV